MPDHRTPIPSPSPIEGEGNGVALRAKIGWRERPIGVFDSGVGGLSVLRRIRAALPAEDLLYVADSGHAPYGAKPPEYIEARSLAIAQFLVGEGAKALVVACNTATAMAIASLRARYELPIVGLEPAVKPAVEATRSGVIGVLATSGTLESARFSGLLGRFGANARVIVQPCVGLVEQVEQGDLSGPATRELLERFIGPLLGQGADTLVLGCTHYPLVGELIREIAGPDVAVIETAEPVSRQLVRLLTESELLAVGERAGGARFWTSGHPAHVGAAIARLWERPAQVEPLPEAYLGFR